ncbi:hypothetical protein GGS26DRAFT_579008 [Hypomontagnella submonticulosa]|nr:hypothetical protein GGS26DRAFT_579008 [Hypomontagnella submonticulosa]
MHVIRGLILSLPIALAGSLAIVERAPTTPFGLYAYGDGIGGAPVFTTGHGAYIGKASRVDDTEAAPVEFNLGTDNSLLANPNATSGESTPTWSNLTFMVPDTTSSSHEVEFTNSTTTNERSTSGFIFYDQFLLHRNLDGSLKSLWYAVPSETEGVWYLRWNSTGDETNGQVLVSLKATAPSKPVDKTQ